MKNVERETQTRTSTILGGHRNQPLIYIYMDEQKYIHTPIKYKKFETWSGS
jgi:hypothetical protein